MLIGFYTEGLEIGAYSLEDKSIGGSESALIYMAREFAKLNHEVKIFCNLDQEYSKIQRDKFGIDWYDNSKFNDLNMIYKFDVFLCYRHINVFQQNINSNLNIVVNHDILAIDPGVYMTMMFQTDYLFNLSKYHCDLYVKKLPELKNFLWQTKNGVDMETLNSIPVPEKRAKRFIYASRPERGLERLLIMWNKIKSFFPDYELAICGYDLGKDIWATLSKQQRDYYKSLEEIMSNMDRVKKYGALTKKEYWALLKNSTAMLYPTNFPEISCINALESMGCGTPIITTNNFAFPETINDKSILIDGDPDSDEYQKKFLQLTKKLCENKEYWKDYSYKGRKWVINNYDWKDIAESWITKFKEILDTRFYRNKDKVVKQLIYNSDVIAAREISRENNMHEYWKLADDIIEKTKLFKEEGSNCSYFIMENKTDYSKNIRFGEVIDMIENIQKKYIGSFLEESKKLKVLDVGCHMGSFSISLANIVEGLYITGLDISETNIGIANNLRDKYSKNKYSKNKDSIDFISGNFLEQNSSELKDYDILFAGEILEHMYDIGMSVDKLESFVKNDGYIIMTIPTGPWESMGFDIYDNISHLSHFEMDDIKSVFGNKKNFEVKYVLGGVTDRGEYIGWWILSYQKSDIKTGVINYNKKIHTRPYQKITAGLITCNEEDNISRCLKSIKKIVDEIIICDTGSTDDTVEIVKKFTTNIQSISNDPDGDGLFNFAWARNNVLEKVAKDTDWFLWLDADEVLMYGNRLRRYLNSPIYSGYVITQNHLMLDMKDVKPDTPVRIFNMNKGIKFYGVVHEQPMESLNKNIHPSLILSDTRIVHFGYITEDVRRRKCASRNIALLIKDRKLNPDRTINLCLLMRDYYNVANWEIEFERNLNEKALLYLRTACKIWEQEFRYNKENPYYGMAQVLYQQILEKLGKFGVAIEEDGCPPINVSMSLAGAVGTLSKKDYKSQLFWFKDSDEYSEWMLSKTEELVSKIKCYPVNGGK
jgi:glycosyltransferase involved in cell wall biosynthesis/cyclopropane fatty-acyl-phospholipid synthase-like methyltransferase